MKTKLSVAVMAFLLAGCSSNDTDSLPENPVNATPIRVRRAYRAWPPAVLWLPKEPR